MSDQKNNKNACFGLDSEDKVLEVVSRPENRIEFIRIIFPDILGRRMDFTIPSSELEKTFKDGKGFDGSSVEGFVRIEESDLVIKPDPKTFRVLPWTYSGFEQDTIWKESRIDLSPWSDSSTINAASQERTIGCPHDSSTTRSRCVVESCAAMKMCSPDCEGSSTTPWVGARRGSLPEKPSTRRGSGAS